MSSIAFKLAAEFARVIQCKACTNDSYAKLLRDSEQNVPQPGYIGPKYWESRVLLVGQNPGTPKSLADADLLYTAALRQLRDAPTEPNYQALEMKLKEFIPQWPVHGNYFPLAEAGLTLDDIAYFNVVRCRTVADAAPGVNLVRNCLSHHFTRWLDELAPRAVVFIGKWAADQAAYVVESRSIPYMFMNRCRSLSSEERAENRLSVVRFVRGETR